MAATWYLLTELSFELSPNKLYSFELKNDKQQVWEIAVYQINDEYHAILDQCPHRRLTLSSKGYFENGKIVCGWHLWQFKAENGEHVAPPTGNCIPKFPIKRENQQLFVLIDIDQSPPF
jgi:nitrite reductase/ring-hydroxylating ferredoxin subunit